MDIRILKGVCYIHIFSVLCFMLSGCTDGDACTIPPASPLDISVLEADVYDGAVTRISFTSTEPSVFIEQEGFTGASGDTPFIVNSFFDGLAGEGAPGITYDPATGEGHIDFASLSNEVGTHVHRIIVAAGNERQEMLITTHITELADWGTYPYVGTFHRWNQTGERVISSASTGSWTARVLTDEGDFVLLDRMPSPATVAGILRTDSPGDAENYQITGDQTVVSGNGRIFFRVGLTGNAPSSVEPRYTRIRVDWKLNGADTVSYIYVRQGEEADYLMRPEDALTNSPNTPPRANAAKFTVFNITDQHLGGGPNLTDHSPIVGGEGVFTDYPSQAGYFFIWNLGANPSYQRAYNPSVPQPGISIVGWATDITAGGFWNTAKDVCPQGYRHASDGIWNAGDVSIFSSEFRQSLFLNPAPNFGTDALSNSIFGYYADGWSDRQKLGASPGASVPLGTAGTGGWVAYIGRLFYNPYSNASVFFPAVGGRGAPNGSLANDAINGIYWTTTSGGGGNAAFMSVYGRMNYQRDGNAGMARCVKE